MRKIISLGLLALTFSLFSSQLFASNVAACDEVKKSKGLHGLCVAWHNANDKNKDKFAEKYRKKSGGDEVPGSGAETVCPCWTPESLAASVAGAEGVFCIAAEDFDAAIYDANDPQVWAGLTPFIESGTECRISDNIGGLMFMTSPEENVICRSDVQVLQDSQDEGGDFVFEECDS